MRECGTIVTVRQATDDSTIRRMRFALEINKCNNIHSEHVTLIACPQQQFLR
jgi:hypothetical protein